MLSRSTNQHLVYLIYLPKSTLPADSRPVYDSWRSARVSHTLQCLTVWLMSSESLQHVSCLILQSTAVTGLSIQMSPKLTAAHLY